MLIDDAHSERVDAWLGRAEAPPVVSDWGLTEFSSALALRARTGRLAPEDRTAAEAALDAWMTRGATILNLVPRDFDLARNLIRLDRTVLKASDALHLAAALRLGQGFASLDKALARAAEDLGLAVEPL